MSDLIGPITRITDPADPHRCQGLTKQGQCPNLADPGSLFCPECLGNPALVKEEIRSYKLARAEDRRRLAELQKYHRRDVSRDMLYMMHMVVEEHFNQRTVGNDPKLVSTLNQLAARVGQINLQLDKSELDQSELLGREALLQSGLVVTKYLADACQWLVQEHAEGRTPTWEDVAAHVGEQILSFLRQVENPRGTNEHS